MKRQHLLIAGLSLAVVSVSLNLWFLLSRGEKPLPVPVKAKEMSVPETSPSSIAAEVQATGAKQEKGPHPAWEIDFSGTAFADDSWKLNGPEPAIKLDKPFDWEDVNPARRGADSVPIPPVDGHDKPSVPSSPIPPPP